MARSTFKVLFYVNGSKEKNGIVPIMGRVTINGTVAQFSCKRTIPKELWDAKGNKAKGKSMEARETNLALDNIKAQIIKHYQRISDREAYVMAEMVRNAYQGLGGEYETLLGAFDKENEVFKKRVGKDRGRATYMARVRARNHVAAFIRSHYKRNDISMPELTPDFIKEFAVFLSNEAGLHNGSIWENCMWLKGVVMRAHFNGHIPRNPFAQFHISPNTKEREYLTENELKTLMEFQLKDPKNSYLRDIFVFASFTALSFVDIKELSNDQIVEVNGEKWIISKRHKTGCTVSGEAAGYSLADNRALQGFSGKQSCIPQSQLLVNMQAYGKDDKGMRHHQENQLSLLKARICDPGSQQRDANRECQPYFGAYEHQDYANLCECAQNGRLINTSLARS